MGRGGTLKKYPRQVEAKDGIKPCHCYLFILPVGWGKQYFVPFLQSLWHAEIRLALTRVSCLQIIKRVKITDFMDFFHRLTNTLKVIIYGF